MNDFVILGLGSNKPFKDVSCIDLLKKAVDELSHLLSDIKISSVYRTKPMYVENQEDFYNMVLCGFCRFETSPEYFLDKIHEIEASLGRNREKEIRNGPRSIDIDIEVFGDLKISSPTLEIPHPRICEREFVLVPLCEMLELVPSKFDLLSEYKEKLSVLKKESGGNFGSVVKTLHFSDFQNIQN